MAFTHGKAAVFQVHDGVGLRNLTAYLTNVSLTRGRDTAETSVLNGVTKTYVVGMASGSISCAGNYEPTADGYLQTMFENAASAAFEYGPAGGTPSATQPNLEGSCFLTAFNIATPIGGTATWSGTFQVTGTIARNLT
ncbi:MAG: phage tail tube protein [Planctomycetota bacterium]